VTKALERAADAMPASPDGTYEAYDQRCADALVELSSARIANDDDPDRATVVVHVDAAVLSGGDGLAEIAGGPEVPGRVVEEIACDCRLQVALHGRDGRPLGIGRVSRSVPAWLAREVRHRDRGCRFPGCERTRLLDSHHVRHWVTDGRTELPNLLSLCRYHHSLCHRDGWSIRGDPNGEVSFVRPDETILAPGPPPLRAEVKQRVLPNAAA
jgi:hypothetical protein